MRSLVLILTVIMSYNVENFFHPEHDSLKNDYEFTADGDRHWSFSRYNAKAEAIARVIVNVGELTNAPMIVGLCEVENDQCLKKLTYLLRNCRYDFVHYESADDRGIDVAMLYRKELFKVLCSRPVPVFLDSLTHTRDILYIKGVADQDTLHLMVCHFPSQLGGAQASAWKRAKAKAVLQALTDSIYREDKNPKIVVMGDFNGEPKDDINGLRNVMVGTKMKSYKYHGQWSCIDQFYLSPAMDSIATPSVYDAEWLQEEDTKYLGLKPKRTWVGYKYNKGGFSDHLPILLDINFSTNHLLFPK